MRTSTTSRTLTVARTGLTIAAIAVASCAADDRTNELAGLTNSAPTMSTASSSEVQPCTGHQSHTLFLEDTDGAAFRLVHVRGCGWKQVAGRNPETVSRFGKCHCRRWPLRKPQRL